MQTLETPSTTIICLSYELHNNLTLHLQKIVTINPIWFFFIEMTTLIILMLYIIKQYFATNIQ